MGSTDWLIISLSITRINALLTVVSLTIATAFVKKRKKTRSMVKIKTVSAKHIKDKYTSVSITGLQDIFLILSYDQLKVH